MYKSLFSIIDMYVQYVPYMGKCPWGKLSQFSQFFTQPRIFSLQIMALLISNISLQNCYSESFTANSYFPLKTQKFFPTDVFPYTVCIKSLSPGDHRGLCNHINVNFNL